MMDAQLSLILDELRTMRGEAAGVEEPISNLWLSWARGMSLMKSEATIASLEGSWKHLGPIIGHLSLSEMNGEFWTNEIIPRIREKTHPGFKFFNMRKWLGMFFKWSDENGKAPRHWRKPRLVDPDPEREKGRIYSVEETTRLEAHADWLLLPKLVMACPHFMRRSEIALLKKDRIDRANQIISLRAEDTKIRKGRAFPYNDRLEGLFRELDRRHAELGIVSPYVFPSPRNHAASIGRGGFSTSWATCKRRAGIHGQAKFHWLRKSALTRALRAPGANTLLICRIAGLDVKEAQSTYFLPEMSDLKREMNVWAGASPTVH